jgi:hypothetical protein
MTSYRKNKTMIIIFCDASCNETEHIIGLGVQIVGCGKLFVESESVVANVPDSLYGELLALNFAIRTLSNLLEKSIYTTDKLERVIIFSDCDIIKRLLSKSLVSKKELHTEAVNELNNLLGVLSCTYDKTIFDVKYIGHRKKCCYYKAAHNIARKVIGKK